MSHELHHFSMGIWVFFQVYATSAVGSYVGLSCVRQAAKDPTRSGKARWLAMAALSIGGIGVWLTHFIGMMGVAVPGTVIRYDLGLTAFSVVLAVGATFFGLWLMYLPFTSKWRMLRIAPLAVGGLVMGLAVSAMHYSGMAAIRIQGVLGHNSGFVVASVIIGIVASIAALWLSAHAERIVVRISAALIMACAVVALHYTGMAGVHATVDPAAAKPEGLSVLSLLFPGFVLGMIALALPITLLLVTSSREERAREDAIAHGNRPADVVGR